VAQDRSHAISRERQIQIIKEEPIAVGKRHSAQLNVTHRPGTPKIIIMGNPQLYENAERRWISVCGYAYGPMLRTCGSCQMQSVCSIAYDCGAFTLSVSRRLISIYVAMAPENIPSNQTDDVAIHMFM
jgi:hypothetical protein